MTNFASTAPPLDRKNAIRIRLALDSLSEASELAAPATQTDFNLMKAILLADYTLELFCPAICDHLQIIVVPLNPKGQSKPPSRFTPDIAKYLDAIYSHFSSGLQGTLISFLTGRVIVVHERRNSVQHDAVVFGQNVTMKLCSDVYEYIDQLLKEVLNLSIGEVNISLSINHVEAKARINLAILEMSNDKYNEAAKLIAEAFSIFETSVFETSVNESDSPIVKMQKFKSKLANFKIIGSIYNKHSRENKYIEDSIKEIARLMHFQQFGVSVMDAMRFTSILPKVDRSPFSEVFFLLEDREPYSKDECQFLLDMCVKIIGRIEDSMLKI